MAERVINLKERKEQPSYLESMESADVALSKERPLTDTNGILIEWSALEYEKREPSVGWFLFTGGIALALVLLGILTRNYFFIALVSLAFFTLIMYIKRGPRRLEGAITQDGVYIGKRGYEFPQLKSFWIFNKPELCELSLETNITFSPFVRVPLKNTEIERLRAVLSKFLPEEEHKEFISDQLARSLGL